MRAKDLKNPSAGAPLREVTYVCRPGAAEHSAVESRSQIID